MKPQDAPARQSPATPLVPHDTHVVVDGETRRLAAALATRYFDGTVTREVLFSSLGDSVDPLIRELLAAIAREPARGFLGVSERQWQRSFREPVSKVIAELEAGADGRLPKHGLIAGASIRSLAGFGIGTIWSGALAIEQALNMWTKTAPAWQQALRFCAVILSALVAAAFALAFRDRLALYRMRRRERPRS